MEPKSSIAVLSGKALKNKKRRLRKKLKARMNLTNKTPHKLVSQLTSSTNKKAVIATSVKPWKKKKNKKKKKQKHDDDDDEENIFAFYKSSDEVPESRATQVSKKTGIVPKSSATFPIVSSSSSSSVHGTVSAEKESRRFKKHGFRSNNVSSRGRLKQGVTGSHPVMANSSEGKSRNFLKGGARLNDESLEDLHRQRCRLPVYHARSELIQVLSEESCIIIQGDTACGKTTQIPQYILESGLAGRRAIAITQPRRVAAISIAERVSKERNCGLGEEVGYCVRFEDVTSPRTKIKYATDGMLLRESISDPLLTNYSWVILDEAHERTIHTDILFGIVKLAQQIREEEKDMLPLNVIVMSATIEEEKMSDYFNGAPVYNLRGREYSIKIFNTVREQEDYVAAALSTVVQIHQNEDPGDILVFLTGEEEISYAFSELLRIVEGLPGDTGLKLQPHVLYAALPSCHQLEALKVAVPGTRKVIFSTNIAETSVTIPGVKYVVDSGMVKCRTYSAVGGLDLLKVQRISKAQADQRAGRAGREFDGSCYRLYTLQQYQNFRDFPIPEIQRCSLPGVLLQIVAIGISDVKNFDFMDKPSDENIKAAIEELKLLGAVEGNEHNLNLTESGNTMVCFPLDPKFSKVIISSQKYKCTDEVLSIISLLSVENIFLNVSDKRELNKAVREKFNSNKGDHITLLNVYKALRSSNFSYEWCLAHRVNYRGAVKAAEIRKQLAKICESVGIRPCSCGQDTSLIRKCFLSGLFMNTSLLMGKKVYNTLSTNQKVFIHPSCTVFHVRPSFVIYTDLVETTKCYMKNVSSVDEEWLEEVAPEYFRSRQVTRLHMSRL